MTSYPSVVQLALIFTHNKEGQTFNPLPPPLHAIASFCIRKCRTQPVWLQSIHCYQQQQMMFNQINGCWPLCPGWLAIKNKLSIYIAAHLIIENDCMLAGDEVAMPKLVQCHVHICTCKPNASTYMGRSPKLCTSVTWITLKKWKKEREKTTTDISPHFASTVSEQNQWVVKTD